MSTEEIEYPHYDNDGICYGCQAYKDDTMTFEDGSQLCPRCARAQYDEPEEEDPDDPNAGPYWRHM